MYPYTFIFPEYKYYYILVWDVVQKERAVGGIFDHGILSLDTLSTILFHLFDVGLMLVSLDLLATLNSRQFG